MTKKKALRKILILVIIAAIFVAFLTISDTYAYWANLISSASKTDDNSEVEIGDWLGPEVILVGSGTGLIDALLNDPLPAGVNKEDVKIILTQDIEVDFNELPDNQINLGKFEGTFDGNGHTLTGTIAGTSTGTLDNNKQGFGLFGDVAISGHIKNLVVELCLVFTETSNDNKDDYYFGGLAAYNSGIIENVQVVKKAGCAHGGLQINFTSSKNGSLLHVGGIVGENKGTILNSSSEIDILLNYKNNGSRLVLQTQTIWIGGLVGKNVNKNNSQIPAEYRARVLNSTNSGKVTVNVSGTKVLLDRTTTKVTLGGVIGYNDAGTHSNIAYTGTFPGDLVVNYDENDRGYDNPTSHSTIKKLVGNE